MLSQKNNFNLDSPTIRCDFHSHSHYSDGISSPTELAKIMFDNSVRLFALTDHDTVEGVTEAQTAANALGIRCLGGIELTIEWEQGTFHLLGLNLKNLNVLVEELEELKTRRIMRNEEILHKLRKCKININMELLNLHCNKQQNEIVNRSHIATYLVDKQYCKNFSEAFSKYLATGSAAYVPLQGPGPEEGIEWIHAAGGFAFVAHPYSLQLSWNKLVTRISDWSAMGLDGLEVMHPRITGKYRKQLLTLCQKLGLEYTGGSDYHSGATEGIIGYGNNQTPIELLANASFL